MRDVVSGCPRTGMLNCEQNPIAAHHSGPVPQPQTIAAMTVQVRFFASLRERLNISDQTISVPAGATVNDVLKQVLGDRETPPNILAAVNMEYADLTAPVRDGDEVAFFPPVTGG